ncbi:MAG: glycosyltransferase family 2 protein [Butyrivibrio sp.]|nr:glycosyltransferase family 2 protein [Butyrivibrio sp.]
MNVAMPLVSVIIPVFRVEDYLEKAVTSILNQTYHNLQVILVDDGSDDACPRICDDFGRKDDRVLVLHKTNGGLSDARNYGLRYVSGEYVYFFDSDDYLEENAISKLVDVAERENADAVGYGYIKVDEYGNVLETFKMNDTRYSFDTEKEKLDFICKKLCFYEVNWEAWGRLYRTSIIEQNELKFEPNKEIFSEDRCFNIYYTLCSRNLVVLSDCFYHYLVRDDSIMRKSNVPKLNETIKLMDYIHSFIEKRGLKYIERNCQYINIVLFNHELRRPDRKDYREYKKSFICNDRAKRFGHFVKRLYIHVKLYGLKQGVRTMRALDRFFIS